MEKNVRDGISVTDIASNLNVTTAYLSRIFKKFMKITPKQYKCRLREAKKGMETDERDIEIAYDNGFSSQSHLCTVFKKYMGISVDDYKKLISSEKQSN